jgi:hypothetical protein
MNCGNEVSNCSLRNDNDNVQVQSWEITQNDRDGRHGYTNGFSPKRVEQKKCVKFLVLQNCLSAENLFTQLLRRQIQRRFWVGAKWKGLCGWCAICLELGNGRNTVHGVKNGDCEMHNMQPHWLQHSNNVTSCTASSIGIKICLCYRACALCFRDYRTNCAYWKTVISSFQV